MDLKSIKGKLDVEENNEKLKNNVKLLLKLYRKVDFNVSDHISEIDEQCFENRRKHLEDIVMSVLEIDNTVDSNKFESQLINLEKSLALLKAMDVALYKLSNYPDNGQIYSEILRYRYFGKEKYNHEYIINKVNLSRSTYYRYLPDAIMYFGVMLFGYALPEVRSIVGNIYSNESSIVAEEDNTNEYSKKL